jgi:glycosyltransferase involved in cell wall biosynthesis
MYGWKGMNVPFCLWLLARREKTWVMFHEVAVEWNWRQPARRNGLAAVTQLMALLTAHSAQRLFVSIRAWEEQLRLLAPPQADITWLPIPSNLPTEVPFNEVAAVRSRLAPDPCQRVIGHFGTFGEEIAAILAEAFSRLLEADHRRVAVVLGLGAKRFWNRFVGEHPQLKDRLHAEEGLPGAQVAAHLAACDVLLQPYPDGVSSRRTSLMAGLALGRPIVTNEGRLTEPLWAKMQAVWLANRFHATPLIRAVERLLANPEHQMWLAIHAVMEYRNRFAINRTIQTLRSQAGANAERRSGHKPRFQEAFHD